MTTDAPEGSPRSQRRRRSIAMDAAELDSFLALQRTCRVATISAAGQPHVTPLWFAWDGAALWLYSIVDSQRWKDFGSHPRIAVVIDAGDDYDELRGVEMVGSVAVVGEVPRKGEPCCELVEPERLFSQKYFDAEPFVSDGRHAWVRLTPTRLHSWDFRKIAARTR